MEKKIELKPFEKVLVRDYECEIWGGEIFLRLTEDTDFKYLCITGTFKYCIPYEGNEHLLGTTENPQEECPKEETEKQDEVSNNYGYPVEYFERNDIVLCRDNKDSYWSIDIFLYKNDSTPYPFRCNNSVWLECIPYEGNEHLIGTTDEPERYDPNRNTLFGIKLKPGYVLEFDDDEIGILFPTVNGFAVSYAKGCWRPLKSINEDSIVRIMGITQTDYLRSGELLWKRPQKHVITKAEIAEKFGMNVRDFEIIDVEPEKNE